YTAMSGVLIVWAVRVVPDLAAEGTVVLFIALAVGQAAGSVALGVLLGASPVLAFVVAGALGILAVLPAVRDPAAAGSRRATR
ncbi:MAG: MFS transporter, partial [Rhodococcus sp. (in: high G+C Gram-positive bacteria)]